VCADLVSIARTRQHLEQLLERLAVGLQADSASADLGRSVRAVAARFGNGMASSLSASRVDRLVRRLARDPGSTITRGDQYLLAHALCSPQPALNGKAVIEAQMLVGSAFKLWEQAAERGDLRPSHWRGLFHSFLQAPPGAATQRLGVLLKNAWPAVRTATAGRVSWTAGIETHIRLLDEYPCDPYVSGLLGGNDALLRDLIANVEVPGASWFWPEMSDALTRAIARWADAEFIERIPTILGLASTLEGARDKVLAATLDRYARCAPAPRHGALLAYALDAWQSPQLARNSLWAQVKPDTKKLVCGWLALEDLEDFYRLCQDARRVDQRRLQFWLRFKGQMDYTQIVLGLDLMFSRDPDIKAFRDRKKGRYAALTSGGGSNNAIIMQIGNRVFVEFSENGNACFSYLATNAPFKLGELRYALTALKGARASAASMDRLIHRGAWERDVFLPYLSARRLYPDDTRDRLTNTPQTTTLALDEAPVPLTTELVRKLQNFDATVIDHRDRGGNLWVIGQDLPGELSMKLLGLGFKYKAGKGWFLP
jgi:hypothetical protein